MHPGRFGDEAFQEQGCENRAGVSRGGNIVQISDFAGKLIIIASPQWHRPKWIVLGGGCSREVLHDAFLIAKKSRKLRSKRDPWRAGQRGEIDDQGGMFGIRKSKGVA